VAVRGGEVQVREVHPLPVREAIEQVGGKRKEREIWRKTEL